MKIFLMMFRLFAAMMAVLVSIGIADAENAKTLERPSKADDSDSRLVVSLGQYYEDNATKTCETIYLNCFLTFATLPPKKQLNATNVSCYIWSASRITVVYFTSYITKGSSRSTHEIYLTPDSYVYGQDFSGAYGYAHVLNAPLRFRVTANNRVQLNIFSLSAGIKTVQCTLTGTLF